MRKRSVARAPGRRSRFTVDLGRILVASLRQAGVALDGAQLAAHMTIDELRRVYGGRLVYVALRDVADRAALAKRIAKLRAEGKSMRDVADRLGISLSYCYEIHASASKTDVRNIKRGT